MHLSIIITAKDKNDQKLHDLLGSIKSQTYRGDFEVLVITEGDSESAKAIGLKRARGDVVCFMASDNYLNDKYFLSKCMERFYQYGYDATSPMYYYRNEYDNALNRYFALFGVNDPIPLYLDKNDRFPVWNIENLDLKKFRTFGDNGFFIKRDKIMQSDLEHYFHIDNINDVWDKIKFSYTPFTSIWHRTGGNIFKFFWKRFKYADKFMVPERRWHMVERSDIPKLLWFIFCTVTLVQPLYLSFKGYRNVHDWAWFLHPVVCWFTLITYTLLMVKRAKTKCCNLFVQKTRCAA